ncbi:ssl1498 family light-harvesting-like protein (plasmid) [Kovacikia minuta CCNUW1]|uniref:photosystem II assembly protein Psb34 n=1 Tax=Kovacikia minuta TaxID=2931930 RepID=UPI001CCF89F0|nr:ssl1498 family light-harvesting-like protein [Kovacikia minuta]UBF29784.1 ssl1498 family light-harvesting-like protein [Kovacikia minuta CCNUW1]
MKSNFSNGSELIPAEVQTNTNQDEVQSIDTPFAVGYTINDEGLINNFAVEPELYPSEYSSLRQQRQYIVLGASAIFFILMLMLVAFSVS